MCLAVLAKIKSIKNSTANVEISGVNYEASLMLTPQAKIGDYVIIHAGFAIQILDQQEAEETLKLFEDIDKATKEELGKRR
jgi:hydrogenase expression/formation protein HypC